jgi:hypothetical protein
MIYKEKNKSCISHERYVWIRIHQLCKPLAATFTNGARRSRQAMPLLPKKEYPVE